MGQTRERVVELLADGASALSHRLPSTEPGRHARTNERFLAFAERDLPDRSERVRDAASPLRRLVAARVRHGSRTRLLLRGGIRPWTAVAGLEQRALETAPALARAGASDLAAELLQILRDTTSERHEAQVVEAGARALLEAAVSDCTAPLRHLLDEHGIRPDEPVELAPAELITTTDWMDADRFRDFVAGKSVALVANSSRLLEAELGAFIDSHDLVMRFNSFVIDPQHTGARTDVHVTLHKHDFNLDVPVDVRILICTRPADWRHSVKVRPQPGAQRYLGDSSLRWPPHNLWRTSDQRTRIPTMGFNMLRTLLEWDVSTTVNLVGFDFYDGGTLRLDEAQWIPHSAAHDSAAEKEWVLAHAVAVEPYVITMRQGDAR